MTITLIKPATVVTVTEYGVLSWSKTLGHHVDECGDLHTALSTLTWVRHNTDASALLVARPVSVPVPAGEWRAVSPDDAVAALEASR